MKPKDKCQQPQKPLFSTSEISDLLVSAKMGRGYWEFLLECVIEDCFNYKPAYFKAICYEIQLKINTSM